MVELERVGGLGEVKVVYILKDWNFGTLKGFNNTRNWFIRLHGRNSPTHVYCIHTT
jgi:hypothetical protein